MCDLLVIDKGNSSYVLMQRQREPTEETDRDLGGGREEMRSRALILHYSLQSIVEMVHHASQDALRVTATDPLFVDLSTSHLHRQLDPSASKLMYCSPAFCTVWSAI